jgi:hypothetical protein
MTRNRLIAALVAVVALGVAVAAAPAGAASQKAKPKVYTAQLNCGHGTVTVVSGQDLFAPLVQRRTGKRFYPVAWDVKAHGHKVKERKKGFHGRSVKCHYDDGIAVGTVRVKAPRHKARHAKSHA